MGNLTFFKKMKFGPKTTRFVLAVTERALGNTANSGQLYRATTRLLETQMTRTIYLKTVPGQCSCTAAAGWAYPSGTVSECCCFSFVPWTMWYCSVPCTTHFKHNIQKHFSSQTNSYNCKILEFCMSKSANRTVSHWQSETKNLIIFAIFVEFIAFGPLRGLAASSKSHKPENVGFLMILEIYRMVKDLGFLENLENCDFLWKTSKIMFDLYSIELKNHQKSLIWPLFVDLKIIQ